MLRRAAFHTLALALSLVLLRSQTGASDPAIAGLLTKLESEPQNAQLCEQIGVAYTRAGDFESAASFFRKALQINPRRIPARKNLATVLWFGGHKKESVEIFGALEKEIPSDQVPPLYLGLHAFEQKDFPKASSFFQRAGSLASGNPEVIPVLIETDLAVGRFDSAKRLVEGRLAALSQAPRSPEEVSQDYRWLAEAQDGLKSPDAAYRAYEQAIEHGPDLEDNYLALGVFAIDHANNTFARSALSRGLQHHPNSPKLAMQMGLTWAVEGNFDKAREFFDSAIREDPHWVLPVLAAGITYLQAGDPKAAAAVFGRARELAPDDYRSYYLRATAMGRSNPGPAERTEMIADLRQAIALNPRQARVRTALAQALISSDAPSAEAQLREALRIDPAEPSALYQLGLLSRRQGKTAEAERLSRAFQAARAKSREDENELVWILKTPK